MTTHTPADVVPNAEFTPVQRVLRYYPQRVQVLVMAVLNLVFAIVAEAGVDLSVSLIAAVNSFAIAALVFFYGEQRTSSKQAVEDWLEASNAEGV